MTVDVLVDALDLDDDGRGSVPAPEPLLAIEDAPDQAVFDAEFVALVVAEQPWGESRPRPRPTPPRRATLALRGSPSASSRRASDGVRHPVRPIRSTGRRPDPRVRSPPPRPHDDRLDEEVMTERYADS